MGTPILDYESFRAEDYLRQKKAIIGAGRCGGKAKGLAYAKCALAGSPLNEVIDFPDLSIVLTTELFDEYIAGNGLDPMHDEEDWDRARDVVFGSPLPPPIKLELELILDRFGELGSPPLAIRSSSLLEDSMSLAFAGKYETCFSSNTGSHEERYNALERSVRTVYASVFNPAARAYREKHGLLEVRESMAVIIQSVAGRKYGSYYYPELAGTLFSRVFRRPNPRIKKEDGLMRVCFGFGTRSVGRCSARTFYLTNPSLRPEGNMPSMIAEASQENFDFIDMGQGEFSTGKLSMLTKFLQKEHRNFCAYVQYYGDDFLYSPMADPDTPVRPIFSFPELHIREKGLFDTSKALLSHLEQTTGFPVDIEFAYETAPQKRLSVLQMRPLALYEEMSRVEIPETGAENVIFQGDRMVSNGVIENVTHLVYVDPAMYKSSWDPAKTSRAVGEANKMLAGKKYILAGPGRWGSRNPALGVPVRYDEICNCGVLVEISVP
ncbi:MAG: PEP/pyruvate-binding domain-containing protein, partial [Synergistaceae bacterium]|nr:PEP/pyruvate-binding domain-containing protein [Synergistaceae bacterium]